MKPVFAACLALSLFACGEAADSPTHVKDLRILAVAAEPPEVLFDRQTDFDSPQVVFSALVADPRGGTTTFTWRLCPVESSQACLNFPTLRDRAPAPTRAMLEGLFTSQAAGTAAPEQSLGALDLPPFAFTWPSELFYYHLHASALGLGNGAWPSALLAVSGVDGEVLAQKRVTLNARELSQFNPELQAAFGFTVCEPTLPAPGCLPVQPRVANKNPALVSVAVARGKLAGLPFLPLLEPLALRSNETVRIQPELSPEAFERYETVQSALQDNRLLVEARQEQPAISWFATAGEFANPITAREITKTFDNIYTAPELARGAPPLEVSLWMVARDLRGGVGWRQVRILVSP